MKYENLSREGQEQFEKGRFKTARTTYSQALDAAVTESASDTQRAAIKLELAKCCRLLAEFEQAKTLLADAITVFESSDPAKHALCLNYMGLVLKDLGQYEEGVDLLEKALAIAEQTHGPQHQDVAEILNNIGLLLWRLSKDEKALKYYDRALSIQGSVSGTNNQLYGEIVDNIGVSLQRLGRYEEALEQHKSSLEIRENSLSQDHPDIGYSLLNLAAAKARTGDKIDLEAMMKRAVSCFEQGFGDSPDTAAAISNLGSFYLEQFRLDDALDCFRRSISIKESVLDPDHPELAIINHNMSTVYKLKGDINESKQYTERACRLLKANMDRDGGANVDTVITLADSLHTDGHEKEALDLLSNTLNKLPESDPRYMRVLEMLGTLHAINAPEEAKEHLSKLLRMQKAELGPKHPNVARTLRALANAFTMQSDQTTAQLLTSQAKVIEFKHGLEDPDATALLAFMGRPSKENEDSPNEENSSFNTQMMVTMLRMQGKDDEADQLEKEEYERVKEKLGGDSADFADFLRNKALRSEFEQSIELLEEALAIQERNPAVSMEDKLKTRRYLVMPLLTSTQYEKAEKLLIGSLALEKALRGEKHWTLAVTLRSLVNVMEKLKKTEEEEMYQKEIDKLQQATPEEEEAEQRKLYEEMEKELSKSLAGLGAMFQSLSNLSNSLGSEQQETAGEDPP